MAKRLVFLPKDRAPFYEEIYVEFQFYTGFSISQKQKSIRSLHEKYMEIDKNANVLEISSKSENKMGYDLSAFNLMIETSSGSAHIENVFQAGKEFEYGGPYKDLLLVSPAEAKKDERLRTSGKLVAFHFEESSFPLDPKDYFYNWIYSKALYESGKDYKVLCEYNAFTDIEFNHEKSINCQARTVAIFVGLIKANLLNDAMKNKDSFLEIVYGQSKEPSYEQMMLQLE